MTIINLGMGLTPFLDNFAHGGGFVLGFLAGVALLPKPKPGDLYKNEQRHSSTPLPPS